MARTPDCYQNFGKRPPIIAIFRFETVSAKTSPLDIGGCLQMYSNQLTTNYQSKSESNLAKFCLHEKQEKLLAVTVAF
jgi:hypothetical protein